MVDKTALGRYVVRMRNPVRKTIDGRTPDARNRALRGASFDMGGNLTGGTDKNTGAMIKVPPVNREAYKVGAPMTGGEGLAFFQRNKTQPQMRPMTGPESPQGKQQTLDRLRGVVADARNAARMGSQPTGATVGISTDGVNASRTVSGKYGQGRSNNGPLATTTVDADRAQKMFGTEAPATTGSGVTGIMSGYRDAMARTAGDEEEPRKPKPSYRAFAKF